MIPGVMEDGAETTTRETTRAKKSVCWEFSVNCHLSKTLEAPGTTPGGLDQDGSIAY